MNKYILAQKERERKRDLLKWNSTIPLCYILIESRPISVIKTLSPSGDGCLIRIKRSDNHAYSQEVCVFAEERRVEARMKRTCSP